MKKKKKDKFIIHDATMSMVAGGFGNDEGNVNFANIDDEKVYKELLELNDFEDSTRLILSLCRTIRRLNSSALILVKELEKLITVDEYKEIIGKLKEVKNED